MPIAKLKKILSGSRYSERKLFAVFFALMVALIIDNSLSQVADIVRTQIVSFWGILLFVLISSVYAFGQFVILESIKAKNKESGQSSMRIVGCD
jgi:H+/Cl- antiporter ClcA